MSTNAQNKITKRPVVQASLFTVAGFSVSQIVRFTSNLILTRLLVPEMFGVMALCMVFIAAFIMFSDTGIRQFINLSKDGLNPRVLDTAWLMQIIRGFLILICMLVLAIGFYLATQHGWVGDQTAYAHPLFPPVLAAMGVIALLNGLQSTKRFEMNRKLILGRITIIDLVSHIAGVALMILLAWIYHSIWALVVGNIFQSFLKMAATHLFLRGHNNTVTWDGEKFREIYAFSRWILVGSIFGYLVVHADILWLGALISAETLGIYSIGKGLALMVRGVLGKLSVSVILPELSNVSREEDKKISQVYYKMRCFIDVPAFFIAGVFMVIGPDLIEFLYDPRYREAGTVFQVFSLFMLSTAFMQAVRCLVALGLVKQRAMITGIYAVSLNLAIPLLFFLFGFYGVLLAIVVSPIIPIILSNYYLYKNGVFSFIKELRFLPLIPLGWIVGQGLSVFLRGLV
jgi:O-antigen/teichoic acid export membrane protein